MEINHTWAADNVLSAAFCIFYLYEQRAHPFGDALCFFERNMKMKEKQNLTKGNITKNLVLFALPLLSANLLQSFTASQICWWSEGPSEKPGLPL